MNSSVKEENELHWRDRWDLETERERDMLQRYHCAAALFQIVGMPDPNCKNELRQRVQWNHEGEASRQNALLELKETIIHAQKTTAAA